MEHKTFMWSCVLTVMDVIVFCLCVDKGLTPIAIVGACYIALRCFGKDSQNAVNLINPAIDKAVAWMNSTREKMEARKEETPEE